MSLREMHEQQKSEQASPRENSSRTEPSEPDRAGEQPALKEAF